MTVMIIGFIIGYRNWFAINLYRIFLLCMTDGTVY